MLNLYNTYWNFNVEYFTVIKKIPLRFTQQTACYTELRSHLHQKYN